MKVILNLKNLVKIGGQEEKQAHDFMKMINRKHKVSLQNKVRLFDN